MTTTRQWILRTLLATLAIAAVGGAIGILIGGDRLTWQIIGSSITISISCLLFQIFNSLSRLERVYHSGLLGMLLTGLEFIMVLLLIWMSDSNLLGPDSIWECLFFIALTLPLCGGLAMIGLYLLKRPEHRLAGLKLLGIAAITQMLFIAASVVDAFRLRNAMGSPIHWWETAWGTLGYGLLAVLILAGGLKGKRAFKLIGLFGVTVGWVMLLYGIWIRTSKHYESFAFATILGMTFAHANVIGLMNMRPGGQVIMRQVVQALAILTAVLAQLTVTRAISTGHEDDWARLTGACGFMLACGTFALLVIHAANKRRGKHRAADESELIYKRVSLTCPHCQTQQSLPVGESQCSQCGMQFQIKLYEPHCPHCDYLLINAASDTCPECGMSVGS